MTKFCFVCIALENLSDKLVKIESLKMTQGKFFLLNSKNLSIEKNRKFRAFHILQLNNDKTANSSIGYINFSLFDEKYSNPYVMKLIWYSSELNGFNYREENTTGIAKQDLRKNTYKLILDRPLNHLPGHGTIDNITMFSLLGIEYMKIKGRFVREETE